MSSMRIHETWVRTDSGRVHAKVWGDISLGSSRPAPVVLLHDSLGCVELWRGFAERLADKTGRTVLAYDRIGFGKSDPHPGRLDLGFVRDEARTTFSAIVEHFGIHRFIAFGHSVGGGMAVEVAASLPNACTGLVTESAQAFVEARTVEAIDQAKRAYAVPGRIERLRRYHGDKAGWVLSAWTDTWLAPEFSDWSIDEALQRVICPVLVVHGQNDEYGSTEHPRRISGAVKGPCDVHVIQGCGHVPHRERSAAVLTLVAGWMLAAVR